MNIAPNAAASGPLSLSLDDRGRMVTAILPAALALVAVIGWAVVNYLGASSELNSAQAQLTASQHAQSDITKDQATLDRLDSVLTSIETNRSATLAGAITLTGFLRAFPTTNLRLMSVTIAPDGSITLTGEARTPDALSPILKKQKGRLVVNGITNGADGQPFTWQGNYR